MELDLPDGARVEVHAFPPLASFQDDILGSWQQADLGTVPTEARRRDLEGRLRQWYRHVVVQPQGDVAKLYGAEAVWYVFRDGRIRKDDARLDRLHVALHDARRTSSETAERLRGATEAMNRATRPRPATKSPNGAR